MEQPLARRCPSFIGTFSYCIYDLLLSGVQSCFVCRKNLHVTSKALRSRFSLVRNNINFWFSPFFHFLLFFKNSTI